MSARPRVLVVDDYAPSRYGFRRILGAGDIDVVEAEDGASARAALTPDIDVAILDVNLPDVNGIELCREIRLSHPQIRVVLISASYRAAELDASWSDAGAAVFLEQPIDAEQLLGTVRRLMD
jgi:two-component system KDP operon response regulator KdpE